MRVILLTGANGGLGQAIARCFIQESPENVVYLGVRKNRRRAEDLAAEFPQQCRCTDLDVTEPNRWQATVGTILAEMKRIDVLVNNAGFHQDHLLATMPLSA